MKVAFLDLKIQYRQIQHEIIPMVTESMENASFIGGPQVSGFETEFAAFCGSKYCVGVNSGTDALRFALMALGVGIGDEVITVPNTFIATTEAISQVGATPAFVDVKPDTYTMDPQILKDFLENKCHHTRSTDYPVNKSTHRSVRAVIPVHLYGQPADMDPILEVARKHNLLVIEDACQAHGATYKDRKAGSLGISGCFSFYPGKNLGAYGEGGAVVTQEEDIADKIRMIRDHGQEKKYFHQMEGYNGRLDAIQAGVLRIKLKRLDNWNQSRRENAAYYNEVLSDIAGVTIPDEADFARSVYHLYVILVDKRDELQDFLNSKDIATGLHYPLPLHLQQAYAHLGYKEGDFPVTEEVAGMLLSLPMFPELTREQIAYVASSIKEFMSSS